MDKNRNIRKLKKQTLMKEFVKESKIKKFGVII